jgi:hypothetical protein
MTDIFVFGSNLAGRHGKGAALHARKHHGAIYGQGEGLQGNSYGIPTKGHRLEVLSLGGIYSSIMRFKNFAADHPELTFNVTPVGCGLAGYQQSDIRPLFEPLPPNCRYSKEWDTPSGRAALKQEGEYTAHDGEKI